MCGEHLLADPSSFTGKCFANRTRSSVLAWNLCRRKLIRQPAWRPLKRSNTPSIALHCIGTSRRRDAQSPMLLGDDVGLARVFFSVPAVTGIVWDSALGRRLAITLLIIVVVCFSLAILFFLRRR